MRDTHLTTRTDTTSAPPQRRRLALTVLLIPAALTLLSVTSVNLAVPAIRDGIGADATQQSLVLTAYALAFALVLLPAGRLGDQFGHKRVFVAGVAVFTAANLWCGIAPDPTQLVLARVLAGVGAGLTMTPVNAIIQLLYKGPERARPFAVLGAVFGASSAVGPLLGGILIHSGGEIGWRLTFLVNVPVGILAVALAIFVLPTTKPLGARGSDPLGMLLFTLGVGLAILPFSLGGGFTVWSTVMLIAGILLLTGFGAWIRARARQDRFAVVPTRLFRQRALPIGVVSTFLGFAGFTSSFLVLALLWEEALGHDALSAGLLVSPFAIGSVVGAVLNRPLMQRYGTRMITGGLTMITAGLAAVGVLVLALPATALTFLVMLVPLLVTGVGVGLFVGPNANAAFVQTEGRDAGVASAMVTAAQRTGTAVGLGILSAMYALLPGGAASLANQAIATFVTAAFAGAAALTLVVTRRSRLEV
ncbi:MFS transporter [Microbacterium sp. GXF7504]